MGQKFNMALIITAGCFTGVRVCVCKGNYIRQIMFWLLNRIKDIQLLNAAKRSFFIGSQLTMLHELGECAGGEKTSLHDWCQVRRNGKNPSKQILSTKSRWETDVSNICGQVQPYTIVTSTQSIKPPMYSSYIYSQCFHKSIRTFTILTSSPGDVLWWMAAPLQIKLLQIKPPTPGWKAHEIKTVQRKKGLLPNQIKFIYPHRRTFGLRTNRLEENNRGLHTCALRFTFSVALTHLSRNSLLKDIDHLPVCRGSSLVWCLTATVPVTVNAL